MSVHTFSKALDILAVRWSPAPIDILGSQARIGASRVYVPNGSNRLVTKYFSAIGLCLEFDVLRCAAFNVCVCVCVCVCGKPVVPSKIGL